MAPSLRQMTSSAPAVATSRITGVNQGPRAPMVIAAPIPAIAREAVRRARILVEEGEAAMGVSFGCARVGDATWRFQGTDAAIRLCWVFLPTVGSWAFL
ncbi:hypothetical protein CHE218_29810 [Microbacterium sp. che218]